MAGGSRDFLLMLRGLELIVEALVRQRFAESSHVWRNSSLRDIPKAFGNCLSTATKKAAQPDEFMNTTFKNAEEARAKLGIVLYGFQKYQEAISNTSFRDSWPSPPSESSSEKSDPHSTGFSYISTDTSMKDADDLNTMPSHGVKENFRERNKFVNFDSQPPVPKIENQRIYSETERVFTSVEDSSSLKSVLEEDVKVAFAGTAEKKAFKPVVPTSKYELHQNQAESNWRQSLSSSSRQRKVPASRISRLVSFGSLGVGLGVGALAEVTRRAIGVKRTDSSGAVLEDNPFLTDANASRIVDTLCRVRGAALKLGQMLSLQDNNMINPKLQSIFERVRQSADCMPTWQMKRVLTEELGPTWKSSFSSFEDQPFAAASIGQVHRGTLLDGTEVAVKIQYPGVAKGIDSDIDNLLALMDVWNILPKGMFIGNLATVIRKELKWEVDYKREAESGKKFKQLVEAYPQYYVPGIIESLSTDKVLSAELIYGTPVDKMVDADQSQRNWVCEQILRLALLEVFHFNFMQTDPNWSNFFYNESLNQLNLLDFGACRDFSKYFVDRYLLVIKGAIAGDRTAVLKYSTELGFMTGYESKLMEDAHMEAAMALGEPFRRPGCFDFSRQETTRRLHTLVPVMVQHRLTPPPEESYSLHRKLSGVFLLCARQKANIDCNHIFQEVLTDYRFEMDISS